jgi:hypothetical protein
MPRSPCGIRIEFDVAGQQVDDAVDMVRHDHEGIDFDAGVCPGNFVPGRLHHVGRRGGTHLAVDDLAEQRSPVLDADGDDVETGGAVVVAFEADGAAVMAFGVVWHVR